MLSGQAPMILFSRHRVLILSDQTRCSTSPPRTTRPPTPLPPLSTAGPPRPPDRRTPSHREDTGIHNVRPDRDPIPAPLRGERRFPDCYEPCNQSTHARLGRPIPAVAGHAVLRQHVQRRRENLGYINNDRTAGGNRRPPGTSWSSTGSKAAYLTGSRSRSSRPAS